MKDLFISVVIGLIANFFFIIPYCDKIRDNLIAQGNPTTEVMRAYYIICTAITLAVAFVVYIIIFIINYKNKR